MSAPKNLVEMLEQAVEKYGTQLALKDPREDGSFATWTYQGLWHDVQKIGSRLRQLGISQGQKVGLLAESRAWWPICDFGIMSVGACTVPIYPSVPSNQVEHIVGHAEMKGIFVQNTKQLRKLLEIDEDGLPNLEFVVTIEEEPEAGILKEAGKRWQIYLFSSWLKEPAGLDEEQWRSGFRDLTRENLATIVYTSGTTGLPKGAMLTHGNLLSNVEGIAGNVQLSSADRSLSYLPLSHIFERTAGQFFPLSEGACITYSRGFAHILEDFQRTPPTVLTTVPRLLEKTYEQVMRQVHESPQWKQRLFERAMKVATRSRVNGEGASSVELALYNKIVFKPILQALGGQLKLIVVGGAPMPAYAGRFFTAVGFTVVEGYGMTETSPVVSVNLPSQPRLGTAGKVLFNVETKIAEDGELLVRGPSVMPGYFHDENATREAFTEDGWLKTGDIGELSPDGYLTITDRKKNLIVLSTGKKVTPAPIEAEMAKNSYLDQVLLTGQGRKYVSAIVVPNEELVQRWLAKKGIGNLARERWNDSSELKDFLLSEVLNGITNLAKFEQPKRLVIAREPFTVENNQLTPTLKVRAKNVLKDYEAELEQMYLDLAYETPAAPTVVSDRRENSLAGSDSNGLAQ